jgi:hypothetical protein
MPSRSRRPKQPDDEIRTDDKLSPVSGRGEGIAPTRINITAGAREDFPDALEEVFGAAASDELKDRIGRVQERESDILEWLSRDPSHLESFVEDPVGTLRKQFPELELPRGKKPVIPQEVTLQLEPPTEVDPGITEIFLAIWQYVGASAANVATFRAAPFSVIASIGRPYPPHKVDQVTRAFEAALGIHRLQAIDVARVIATARERP